MLKGKVARLIPASAAAARRAVSEADGFFSVAQATTAGAQAAIAQPISRIVIWPTPVLKRNEASTCPLIENGLVPAAAAAAPMAPPHIATAPIREASNTENATRLRQIERPREQEHRGKTKSERRNP